MKKKIMTMTLAGLVGLSVTYPAVAAYLPGTAVWGGPETVLAHKQKSDPATDPCNKLMDNWVLSLWLDPGMWVATGVDMAATYANNTKTVKAQDAIDELEDVLKGNSGCSGNSDSTSQDASAAETYTPENVLAALEGTKFELSEKKAGDLFDSVRQEIIKYLFASSDSDIKADCTNKDSDCAEVRQNQWLLASVTLASATADKVLETTVKSGEKDETNEEGETTTTKGGSTPLTGHFQKLASSFNSQTVPTGMYDAMANIVLDTHRQMNEANALLGRDLEAQGLRAVVETGVQNLNETEG